MSVRKHCIILRHLNRHVKTTDSGADRTLSIPYYCYVMFMYLPLIPYFPSLGTHNGNS